MPPTVDRPSIISADSRQVYRGLDIGTAKATAADRARVPHFGLDLVDPDEPFSLADFATHARASSRPRRDGRRRRDPRRGDRAVPPRRRDRARYRTRCRATRRPRPHRGRARRDGLDALVARLRSLAPTPARRVDLRNPRRSVRALEIARAAGRRAAARAARLPGPVAWIGLAVPPDARTRGSPTARRAQFDAGLIDEAAALRERYDPSCRRSRHRLPRGWAVLDGLATRDEAIELDAHRNVAFAKRQRTWFRSEPAIRWLDPTRATRCPPRSTWPAQATG
jgi:tRNA dimethylallyltransferase